MIYYYTCYIYLIILCDCLGDVGAGQLHVVLAEAREEEGVVPAAEHIYIYIYISNGVYN